MTSLDAAFPVPWTFTAATLQTYVVLGERTNTVSLRDMVFVLNTTELSGLRQSRMYLSMSPLVISGGSQSMETILGPSATTWRLTGSLGGSVREEGER